MFEQNFEVIPQKTVIMVAGEGSSAESTIAQRESVGKMTPKITQYVDDNLTNDPLLENYRLARAKIIPEATMITPELAKKIIQSMGIELEGEDACLQAYHLLSVTENFSAAWRKKQPSAKEKVLQIQQSADTLAEDFYDLGQGVDQNVTRLDNVLEALKIK